MRSRALTISARHTSSTVPTRLRQRHSLRDNEWRAIARALIAEVRRPFLSHHSTRKSIAPAGGGILTPYPSNPGCAHHDAQRWDSGYPWEQRLPGGRLGPPRPSQITRPLARTGAPTTFPLLRSPNPLRSRRTTLHLERLRCEDVLLARPKNGWTKTCGYRREPLAP